MKKVSYLPCLFVIIVMAALSAGCSGGKESNSGKLESSKWNLVFLRGVKPELPEGKYITLEINTEKGNISGKAPCNSYSAAYDLYNEQLKFSAVISTKMACEDLTLENEYFSALGNVNSYKITDSKLILINNASYAPINLAEFVKVK